MARDNMSTYKNAVAVVTGGASGIGRALALELSRRGAEVILADLQIEEAKKAADQIRNGGGRAYAVQTDVTDFSAVEDLIIGAFNRTGRLDYVFDNAGIVTGGTVYDLDIDDWNKTIDVNLRGIVNGVHAASRIMKKQGFGHIVNTASMAGLMPNPMNIPYAATKHAVVGLSLSLRAELAHLAIRVSVICPGLIRTPMLDGGRYGAMKMPLPPEKRREIWEKRRPMPPEIFARRVLSAVAKNQAVIIFPLPWKIIWWLNRLSPSLGVAFARRSFASLRRECHLP